jgi:hypothetical protein
MHEVVLGGYWWGRGGRLLMIPSGRLCLPRYRCYPSVCAWGWWMFGVERLGLAAPPEHGTFGVPPHTGSCAGGVGG